MLSKIAEAFKHSSEVLVKIQVIDEDTGVTLEEEYFCESGLPDSIAEGIQMASSNIEDILDREFNS